MRVLDRAAQSRAVQPPVGPRQDSLRIGASIASKPWRRAALGLGWAALLAPFLFEILTILRAGHLALIRRVPDDAFYYLEIAGRLSRGQGFTFDGIHTTNGFHPLWQLALVPFGWVFGSGDAGVRAVLIFGVLCCLVAVLLFVRLAWSIAGPGPALLGGVAATQFALSRWVDGMEGPVVLLALALLATALAAADASPSRRMVVVAGAASALLVLARLDFAPLLLVLAIAAALEVALAPSSRLVDRRVRGAGGACNVVVAAELGSPPLDERNGEERDARAPLRRRVWWSADGGVRRLSRRRHAPLRQRARCLVSARTPIHARNRTRTLRRRSIVRSRCPRLRARWMGRRGAQAAP